MRLAETENSWPRSDIPKSRRHDICVTRGSLRGGMMIRSRKRSRSPSLFNLPLRVQIDPTANRSSIECGASKRQTCAELNCFVRGDDLTICSVRPPKYSTLS
jgi:hypothetical protein